MGTIEALINFTSLGMLILDEVHLPSGKVVENVIGGSGAYGKCSDSGPAPFCCHDEDGNKYSYSWSPALLSQRTFRSSWMGNPQRT